MFDKIIFTLIALLIISTDSRTIQDSCRVSIDLKTGDLKDPQPLILSKNKIGTSFLYPNDKEGQINIPSHSKINLACPGKKNYLHGIKELNNNTEIEVKCLRGKTFSLDINDNNNNNNLIIFNITNITCEYLPKTEALLTAEECFYNATYIEIGFPLQNEFLYTMKVCHDIVGHTTYYTEYKLTEKIGYRQAGSSRPQWSTGQFFTPYDMAYLYKMTTQFDTILNTVGSEELAKKYMSPGTVRYLSRGHMVANADFVYRNQQRSTFWYVNAAPQWQSFNGGNWNTLEGNVRTFAAKRLLNLDVYTGVHGQMKLIDINGNLSPLFLFVNATYKALPVPEYYWKIIYDPVEKLGTAFVGLNDPYAAELNNDIFLCEDISNKIKWLTWSAKNITKGISYACTIDDIREAIPSIPKLEVYDILI